MTDEFAPSVGDIVRNNAAQAAQFHPDAESKPQRHLAIVTCMDARIDAYKVLGLRDGEAHVIRNAGGVITDDVIRSLVLSQRFMGTREIILVHHTDCGLQNVDEEGFRNDLQAELGVTPSWALDGFADAYADIAFSIERLLDTPFLPHKENISGFVYDVDDHLLHPVD